MNIKNYLLSILFQVQQLVALQQGWMFVETLLLFTITFYTPFRYTIHCDISILE